MGEMRNAPRLMGGESERKRLLATPTHTCEDNIKKDLIKIVWKMWTGFNWLRRGSCEHGNEPTGSIKV